MKPYALGLDLGIASIGWAVGPVNDLGDLLDIELMGTFCYPSPISEVKKGRRTTNRSNRGALRRARHRLYHFKARRRVLGQLLIELGWWPSDEAEQIKIRTQKLKKGSNNPELAHPIALKVKGLTQSLEPYELGCIFLHYQRHRGYLSTADLPALLMHKRPVPITADSVVAVVREELLTEAEKELRGLNNWIKSTRNRLHGRTISQFQLDILELNETPSKRNPAIRARLSPPSSTIKRISDEKLQAGIKQSPATDFRYDRWMYLEEFDRLWSFQSKFHTSMTDELRHKVEKLVFHQDPLESKEECVGMCELIPTYRRCRVGELVFQRHRILSNLAHTSIDGEKLTDEERRLALEFLMQRNRATFAELKTVIGKDQTSRFPHESLPTATSKVKGKPKQTKNDLATNGMKGSDWGQKLCKLLNITGASLVSGGIYDDLVHDLISLPEVSRYRRLTEHYGIADETAIALMSTEPPKGYARRCSRVLRRIEPHLFHESDLYSATIAAGYAMSSAHSDSNTDRLTIPIDWTTGNPSVDSAVRWSAKVINEVILRHGKPMQIKVELPRQMAMGNEARAEEWARINERAKLNDGYAKKLEIEGLPVTRKNLTRMKLADESGWRSPYEPETEIPSIRDLVEYYDLDHIVPQSHCAEDGLGNLVLCPYYLNHEKGNRTPFEAFGDNPNYSHKWYAITQFVRSCSTMPRRKQDRILAMNRPEQNMEARMLTQLGHIGTQITQLLKQLNVDTVFVNGSITAEVRRRYGLQELLPKEESQPKVRIGDHFVSEKNRSDLRHHAVDAASILLVDRSLAMRLTRYFQTLETWRSKKQKGDIPGFQLEEPFPGVRNRIRELLLSAPVVRPQSRGYTGALHGQSMLPLTEFKNFKGKANTYGVHGANIFRYGLDGTVTGAWRKSTVHHGRIFETLSGSRSLDSVSLFEVADLLATNKHRVKAGLRTIPIVDRTSPNPVSRFVMSISNGDYVEYIGDKGNGSGIYRVGTVAVGKGFEITLFWLTDALSVPSATSSIRIRSAAELKYIRRRIVTNIFGEVIWSEPTTDD